MIRCHPKINDLKKIVGLKIETVVIGAEKSTVETRGFKRVIYSNYQIGDHIDQEDCVRLAIWKNANLNHDDSVL